MTFIKQMITTTEKNHHIDRIGNSRMLRAARDNKLIGRRFQGGDRRGKKYEE